MALPIQWATATAAAVSSWPITIIIAVIMEPNLSPGIN